MTHSTGAIWGIHACRLGEAEALFKKGYIALGWVDMGDLSALPPVREAFKAKVAATYPHDKPGSIPVSAGQLFRFVHELEVSDLVVSRSKLEQIIRIGRVTGEYRYAPDLDPAYPHLRSVTWLTTLQPTHVSQGARYELGAAMTLFQIKTYADEWRGFVNGKKTVSAPTVDPDPGEDPTVKIVAEEIEVLTRDFVLQQLAKELKGHPFAAFVAHLLGTMGYRTRVSPEGPDGGIDIIAHQDELGFEPPIVKVQVKSTGGNIGQPDVSALLGTLATNEFGLVVTLGGFTTQARTFAKSKANLRLIDGDELVNIVLSHYEQFGSRYKGLLPLKRIYVPEPIDAGEV